MLGVEAEPFGEEEFAVCVFVVLDFLFALDGWDGLGLRLGLGIWGRKKRR